ncbi:hypothetical protein PVK06_022467 [Gossypium arboreum]|uniref:Uncharacterized protein n=1 Tax=Gossypium arboreum TaxID=29729 RepID=A0ABR0P8I4_GOSAR|nr:hypothetical protein PVK06_022467 [Gossypium arboreum]
MWKERLERLLRRKMKIRIKMKQKMLIAKLNPLLKKFNMQKMLIYLLISKNVRKMLKQYLRSPRMDFKLVLLDLFAPTEEERLESLLIEGKVKQPVAEAEKELQSWEQKRKKNEVGGEEKAKQERSTSESEGAIKEKQLSNCNEGQNY